MSELPNGWCPAPLKSNATVVSGVGFPKKYQGIQSEYYPVYKVKDVSKAYLLNNALLNTADHTVSKDIAKLMKGKIFKEGTTVFAKIGEALKLNRRVYLSKEGLADNNVMGVKPELDEMNSFIFRYLQLFDIASLSRSTTVPSIRKSDVEDIEINLPPLNEQIRIANKLDSLLDKLEATQKHLDKIPTLLKRFRQSVLAAAVSGELTKEWRLKKDLGLKLQEEKLVNIVSNIQIGPFGSLLHKSDYVMGEIPIINPMHITSGKIFPSQNMTISSKKHGELKRYHLKEGDVILGRRGEMGRAAVITKNQVGWLCGTGALFLRFDHKIMSPDFLWLVMTSPSTIEKLVKGSVGSTMINLNQKILKNLEINFPKIKEQKQIVHQVESLFKLADKVEQQYQAAKQRTDKLTQSILAKAFRGELVPQDPNDEQASELLKKIKAQQLEEAKLIRPNKKKNNKKVLGSDSNTAYLRNIIY